MKADVVYYIDQEAGPPGGAQNAEVVHGIIIGDDADQPEDAQILLNEMDCEVSISDSAKEVTSASSPSPVGRLDLVSSLGLLRDF